LLKKTLKLDKAGEVSLFKDQFFLNSHTLILPKSELLPEEMVLKSELPKPFKGINELIGFT